MSLERKITDRIIAKHYDANRDGKLEFKEWASRNIEAARQILLVVGVSPKDLKELRETKADFFSQAYGDYVRENAAHFPSGNTRPTVAEVEKFKNNAVILAEDVIRARSAADRLGALANTKQVELDLLKAGGEVGLDYARQLRTRIEREILKR